MCGFVTAGLFSAYDIHIENDVQPDEESTEDDENTESITYHEETYGFGDVDEVIEEESSFSEEGIVWQEPADDWYKGYEYEVDESSSEIFLTKGYSSLYGNIVIPPVATINGKNYGVVIKTDKTSIWEPAKENITGIKIQRGVRFYNNSCANLFSPYKWSKSQVNTELETIVFEGFDSSTITDMHCMFFNCQKLVNLDISDFDTSNVTNMNGMFYDCHSLTNLDVSKFNTSKVTDMNSLFYNLYQVESLDVSKFDTSNVTDMADMFYNCNKLTNVDVSGFKTSNVTNMSGMFNACRNLKYIDVSSFNTSKVTNMKSMFCECKNLTSLNVSKFDTTNVTNMSELFDECESLTVLDVSNFSTSNVTDMSDMFYHLSNITNLNLKNFNTSKVKTFLRMFNWCTKLESVDVSSFDTSSATHFELMFSECHSLKSIDVSGFDTSQGRNMDQMFYACGSLKELDLSNFDTSNVTDMSIMFNGCSGLEKLNISSFNTSNVKEMWSMFNGCKRLPYIDLRNFTISEGCNIDSFFNMSINGQNVYNASGIVLLPAAWKEGYDFGINFVNKNDNFKTGKLVRIYFAGSEEQWKALNNSVPTGVEIIYNYTGDVSDISPVPVPEPNPIVESEKSPMCPVPIIDENTTEIHLVKGQKYTLSESGWISSDNKRLSISKKNVVNAKGITSTPVKLIKGDRSIDVYITKPTMAKKSVTIPTGSSQPIGFNYDSKNLPVLYYSNALDVATVSETGAVTAVAKGTATITAYVNGYAYTCKVKVREDIPAVDRTLHMTLNGKKTISIKGVKKVTWVSDDEKIVSVTKKNKIKAEAVGETVLRTEYEGKEYRIHVFVENPTITTKEIQSAGKNKYMLNLAPGGSTMIEFAFIDQPVIFKSSKGETAYVGADGTIHANRPGKAKLTAKINGKTITIMVTVK